VRTHWHIDATPHASNKSEGSITSAGDSASGMPCAQKQLDKGLWSMWTPLPRLWHTITRSCQIGSQSQRVAGGGYIASVLTADLRHRSQSGTDIP
jgi:hypothetical protein